MQINFVGQNIELTSAIKNHTTEKLAAVANRFNQIDSIEVVLHMENITHIAEATLQYRGDTIRTAAKSENIYHSINTMVAKILGQVTRHKDKSLEIA